MRQKQCGVREGAVLQRVDVDVPAHTGSREETPLTAAPQAGRPCTLRQYSSCSVLGGLSPKWSQGRTLMEQLLTARASVGGVSPLCREKKVGAVRCSPETPKVDSASDLEGRAGFRFGRGAGPGPGLVVGSLC